MEEEKCDKYKKILENINDIIVLVDRNGIMHFISDSEENILGLKPSDRVGQSIFSRIHPDDTQLAKEHFVKVLAGEKIGVTVRIQHGDGHYKWFDVVASKYIKDNDFDGMIVTLKDITDIKNALDEIQHRDAQISAILENTPYNMWYVDSEYKVQFVNKHFMDAFYEEYGVKIQLGRRMSAGMENIIDKDFWKKNYDRSLDGDTFTVQVQFLVKKKNVYHQVTFSPVKFDENICGILIISVDIMDYIILSNAAKHTTNAKIITDNNRKIIWVNDQFTELTGYTSEEAMGKSPGELLQGKETDKDTVLMMRNNLNAGKGFDVKILNYTKNGKKHWSHSVVDPICGDNGYQYGWIGIHIDVTEKMKQEQELHQERIKAEESNRLKSIFLANMSHEIRTPMNGIMSFTELLRQELLLTENKKLIEYIDLITKSGFRLLNLLNDIIDVSKIEANKIELKSDIYNVNNILQKEIAIFDPMVKSANLALECSLSDDVFAFIDESRFIQVFSNVMSNAIKFTPAGGKITIKTGDEQDFVYVKISDSGIGIDKIFLRKIFEPFAQESNKEFTRSQDGAGLGLAIAKKFLTLMHGDIRIYSKKGEGTTVKIFLPKKHGTIVIPPQTPNGDSVLNETEIIGMNIKVLIVEDDRISAAGLYFTLSKYMQVSFSYTAEESFELIETLLAQNQVYDVVLMDIRLTHPWDGFKLKDEIQKRYHDYRDIPFIAETAYTMQEEKERIHSSGFNAYVEKPIVRGKLLKTIVNQVEKSRKKE